MQYAAVRPGSGQRKDTTHSFLPAGALFAIGIMHGCPNPAQIAQLEDPVGAASDSVAGQTQAPFGPDDH